MLLSVSVEFLVSQGNSDLFDIILQMTAGPRHGELKEEHNTKMLEVRDSRKIRRRSHKKQPNSTKVTIHSCESLLLIIELM